MPASGILSLGGIQYEIFAVDATKEGTESAKQGIDDVGVHYDNILANIAFSFNMIAYAGQTAFGMIQEGFAKTVGSVMNLADQLDYTADITGISLENLQRLRTGGIAVGASFDSISFAIKMFSQKVDAGGEAGENFRKHLERLGVTIKDTNGQMKDQYTLFLDTMQALSGISNVTERNSEAMAIYGRNWASLAPIMKNYEEFAKAIEGSTPITEHQIEAAHRMKIEMEILQEKMNNVGVSIGTSLLPATREWMDLISGLARTDSPVMKFFDYLNEVLVKAAQGFQIIGYNVEIVSKTLEGDLEEAKRIQEDYLKWLAGEINDDKFRAMGWYKNKNGQWTNPLLAEPEVPTTYKESVNKETEGIDALTSAYMEYTQAMKDAEDQKKSLAELDKEYVEDLQQVSGNIAAAREILREHKRDEAKRQESITESETTVSEAKTKFALISSGVPEEDIPGTDKYNQKQAILAAQALNPFPVSPPVSTPAAESYAGKFTRITERESGVLNTAGTVPTPLPRSSLLQSDIYPQRSSTINIDKVTLAKDYPWSEFMKDIAKALDTYFQEQSQQQGYTTTSW